MSSWNEITWRPINRWPGERTPPSERRRAPFSAPWASTVQLLNRELRMIGAEQVVLQAALAEGQIRLDGKPYASARIDDPSIILSAETNHGALMFAVDTFRTWQENLRAIALALEALRKVDRYGVTKSAEQYQGWRALPAGESAGEPMTVEDAQAFIDEHGGSYREAAKRLHPDAPGGDEAAFLRLTEAQEVLS